MITSLTMRTMIRHTYELISYLGHEHIILLQKYCLVCKKFHAKPMTQQMAPLLTSCMTAYQPPFSFSGMDILAPCTLSLEGVQ